jgi:DNA-binding SARP family transcriptional activator
MGDPPTNACLSLLDGFALRQDGRDVDVPASARRVLAFLGLHRSIPRVALAGQLWPDAPEQRALGNLRTALWRVPDSGLLIVDAHAVQLHPRVVVDVDVLAECAAALRSGIEPPAAWAVLAQGEGELLPGWYDDWALLERERIRQLRLHALEDLGLLLCRTGRYGEAVQSALALLRAEPLRESSHRLLIRVHLAEGNPSEALRHHADYTALLARELGIVPSPRMSALVPAADPPLVTQR